MPRRADQMNPRSEFTDPEALLTLRARAPKWLVALEAAVGTAVETAAALLVAVEEIGRAHV